MRAFAEAGSIAGVGGWSDSGLDNGSPQCARCSSAIETWPVSNCSWAQARSPASTARRHRVEQKRWGLPPVDRRSKALPHQGHVLVFIPTPRVQPQHRNIRYFSMG